MKNIVVGIDFSKSSYNALKHAVAISIKTQGKIHLVWVKTPSTMNKVPKSEMKAVIKKAQSALTELVGECKREAPTNSITSVILEGRSPNELTKYAANLPDAMLVMGTHGMSGKDVFAGSNAMKAVGLTSVPLLILREDVTINRDLIQILTPIDYSFETLQKMKHVIAMSKAFAAKVLLLGINAPLTKEVKHTIKVQLRNAGKMCEEANVRYSAATIDVKGNVPYSIVEYAKNKDINLITVMREEEDDFSNFWVASATRQLVNTATMPLLIIPNITISGIAK